MPPGVPRNEHATVVGLTDLDRGQHVADGCLRKFLDGVLPADTRTLTLALAVGLVTALAGGLAVYRYRRTGGSSTGLSIDAVQPSSMDPAIVAVPVFSDDDGDQTDADASSADPQTEDTHD